MEKLKSVYYYFKEHETMKKDKVEDRMMVKAQKNEERRKLVNLNTNQRKLLLDSKIRYDTAMAWLLRREKETVEEWLDRDYKILGNPDIKDEDVGLDRKQVDIKR